MAKGLAHAQFTMVYAVGFTAPSTGSKDFGLLARTPQFDHWDNGASFVGTETISSGNVHRIFPNTPFGLLGVSVILFRR